MYAFRVSSSATSESPDTCGFEVDVNEPLAIAPLVWALVMGLLAAFVAYGRYALRPHH